MDIVSFIHNKLINLRCLCILTIRKKNLERVILTKTNLHYAKIVHYVGEPPYRFIRGLHYMHS